MRPEIRHAAACDHTIASDVGVLLTEPGDVAGMKEEYARWFPTDLPTRYAAKLGQRSQACSSRSG
ncbi:hypothetical protein J2X46_004112 [Nocardioides sp. BE266]|uniref:hypothetical protein n=1 Tax=Nocardioides sp. BE266 TaxID=2817725 RepID=UPI002854416E|nr:hypothetical protein [Nocardioides sp. BE266]MDR7255110.1 hypothetical protein [Nocardioides sp. BE266]